MSNTTPRKMNKTQRALAYALLAMLERMPFSKITVNDICEEAIISRSSFYVHFQDKYDLLHFALLALKEQLRQGHGEDGPKENIAAVVSMLKEKQHILRHLMEDATNAELRTMMQDMIIEDFAGLFEEAARHITLSLPVDITAVFYASGITGLLFYWAKGGFVQSPAEIAEYIFTMLTKAGGAAYAVENA